MISTRSSSIQILGEDVSDQEKNILKKSMSNSPSLQVCPLSDSSPGSHYCCLIHAKEGRREEEVKEQQLIMKDISEDGGRRVLVVPK
jgi:hypothetical protein